MTKVVILETELTYPVGPHISTNMSSIKVMASEVIKFAAGRPITLWVGGSSGALIGGIIAHEIAMDITNKGIRVNYVYKENEHSHHSGCGDFSLKDSVDIIVDDFVVTGRTINRIMSFMKKVNTRPDCLCVGDACTARGLKKLDYLPKVIITSCVEYSRIDPHKDGKTFITVNHSITESGEYDFAEYFSKIPE